MFICVHNSAKARWRGFGAIPNWRLFGTEDAGIRAQTHNPAVVLMKEVEIEISHKKTREILDRIKAAKMADSGLALCDKAGAEPRPIFPGNTKDLR